MWYNEYREHLLGDEWLQEKRPGYIIKNTDWNALFNLNRAQGNNSEETLAAMLDDFFGESVDGVRVGGRFEDIADAFDDINDKIEELENHSVFVCTEDVTTFAEAKEAFEAGRLLIGTDGAGAYYRLDYYDGVSFSFMSVDDVPEIAFLTLDSDDEWSSGTIDLQTKIDAAHKLPAEYIEGGGGGTTDYTELNNKPQINGVTLTGNKSLSDIGAASTSALDLKYTKPSNGIPLTDLASAVKTSLGKADSAYQKPLMGIPQADLASAVKTSLGKADSAYQKPLLGIPKTDLSEEVQEALDGASAVIVRFSIDEDLVITQLTDYSIVDIIELVEAKTPIRFIVESEDEYGKNYTESSEATLLVGENGDDSRDYLSISFLAQGSQALNIYWDTYDVIDAFYVDMSRPTEDNPISLDCLDGFYFVNVEVEFDDDTPTETYKVMVGL